MDIKQSAAGGLDSYNLEFSVSPRKLDEAENKETEWCNDYAEEGFGLLDGVPEYKEPIRALARWAVGRGFETDDRTKTVLENLQGSGEDSFQSICTNHIIVKKTNGEAFAEIIRNDKGTLINLKPLNPKNVKVVYNSQGLIIKYKVRTGKNSWTVKETKEILHSINDRIASENHGTPPGKPVNGSWKLKGRLWKDTERSLTAQQLELFM